MSQISKINNLYELAVSQIAAKSFHIAIELKLDEILLKDNYYIIDDLANKLKFNIDGLKKILRILDAYEVLTFDGETVKANSNTPLISYWNSPHILLNYKTFDSFIDVCKNNKEVFSQTYGATFYEYLLENQSELDQFRRWCTNTAQIWLPSILDMYNFGAVKKIADIGGGEGLLVGLILQKYISLQAILFDQKSMIDASLPILKQFDVEKRVTTMVGDFFDQETLPQKQDLYILCRTLLNWSNADACKILNNCAQVMNGSSKLLVIDFYIPDKSHPYYKRALLSDAALLTIVNSSNRTIPEWENLIGHSKLRINKIYTDDINKSSSKYESLIPLCIIETVLK